MPRQSNGTYQQPANTAAVSSNPISSTAYNSLITDLGNEITNSLDRAGRSAMTAPLPMGGQKITGMADPTVATDGATKNYVDTITGSFFSTGDAKITLKSVADPGWVLCTDGTIGSATSGASTRANADTQALFNLLFNNITDTDAPLFTSGGGATTRAAQTNAALAWAANCRVSLTKVLGCAIAGAGSNGGPHGVWRLGQKTGEELHTLIESELPAHRHSVFLNDPGHAHSVSLPSRLFGNFQTFTSGSAIAGIQVNNGSDGSYFATTSTTGMSILSGDGVLNATLQTGGNAPHNTMQPTSFWNVMVKL
ncbi:microcystin-dependent protein [Bradyrhizobium elkanii]|uniref:hypothetical protein n=1 Tax=Bradyrhizobium elkanii TaxID=29448 RepID=UPI0021675EC8|nr:hypothetical protein [Bradyrhizobium elkanii]MCS3451920.1 microcystin-dependent protein [Bradyrhizobium elkanii]MCS3565981.1 microcystin-dependent protein [Bradyrhizobium elkanii]MCW2153289.1 microcystin-dependent protein [Bradyrhizobium elkanii]MCW2377022.1 microcystin-dependent protein [Bradyrhizobium elkanii]